MCWRVCLYFHVCVGLSCNLLSHAVGLGLFCMCVLYVCVAAAGCTSYQFFQQILTNGYEIKGQLAS